VGTIQEIWLRSKALARGVSRHPVDAHFLKKFKENSLIKSLIILWENIPPGHPVFNVWLKAC